MTEPLKVLRAGAPRPLPEQCTNAGLIGSVMSVSAADMANRSTPQRRRAITIELHLDIFFGGSGGKDRVQTEKRETIAQGRPACHVSKKH